MANIVLLKVEKKRGVPGHNPLDTTPPSPYRFMVNSHKSNSRIAGDLGMRVRKAVVRAPLWLIPGEVGLWEATDPCRKGASHVNAGRAAPEARPEGRCRRVHHFGGAGGAAGSIGRVRSGRRDHTVTLRHRDVELSGTGEFSGEAVVRLEPRVGVGGFSTSWRSGSSVWGRRRSTVPEKGSFCISSRTATAHRSWVTGSKLSASNT